MSKTLQAGYADTPIDGVTSLNFPRGLLNLGNDWKIQKLRDNECIIANLKAPLDRPETIRLSWESKDNIYAASSVDPSVRPASKRGFSFVVQHERILSVVDSDDPQFREDIPIKVHMVCSYPAYELLTADALQLELGRLISGLFNTGSESTDRLAAIMRGAVQPQEV